MTYWIRPPAETIACTKSGFSFCGSARVNDDPVLFNAQGLGLEFSDCLQDLIVDLLHLDHRPAPPNGLLQLFRSVDRQQFRLQDADAVADALGLIQVVGVDEDRLPLFFELAG